MRRRMSRKRCRRGTALVEITVILPLMLLLVLGMLEATRMCAVAQTLSNAARDGCRVAVSSGKTSQDVTTRVDQALTAAGIAPALVTRTLSPSSIETTTLNTQITLTLSVNFSSVNWFASPFVFKSQTVTSSVIMLSQRP